MFLFLKMIFILKLHAHTEWHIVDSVDNVLYCQFDCCWFCVFVLGFLCFGGVFLVFIFGFGFVVVGVLFLCLGFFFSTCYCCFIKWSKGIFNLLPLSSIREKNQIYLQQKHHLFINIVISLVSLICG